MQEAVDGLQQPAQTYEITRRCLVTIRGSFQQFGSAGPEAASWTPVNGKVGDVFGISDIVEQGADSGFGSALLQHAVLNRVSVLETKNDFPLPLGVSISCIPSDESTRTGHKYAMTCLANSHNPNPLCLFEIESTSHDNMAWRKEYPQYNATNLDKHGVLDVAGESYVFVSKNHPAIKVLRSNKDKLKQNIDEQPLIDNEWYKVSRQVMAACTQQLRQKVLNKVNTRDLNNFTVQLHRIGNKDWTSLNAHDEITSAVPNEVLWTDDPDKITKHVGRIMATPYSFSARIELTYEVIA
jgi:hypothetical protein